MRAGCWAWPQRGASCPVPSRFVHPPVTVKEQRPVLHLDQSSLSCRSLRLCRAPPPAPRSVWPDCPPLGCGPAGCSSQRAAGRKTVPGPKVDQKTATPPEAERASGSASGRTRPEETTATSDFRRGYRSNRITRRNKQETPEKDRFEGVVRRYP